MPRKRINISVDEQTYNELQKIRRRYGFRNLCEISVALLHLLSRYINAAENRHKATEDNEETITNMFNEMGRWEQTPDDVTPFVHHHHKGIKED